MRSARYSRFWVLQLLAASALPLSAHAELPAFLRSENGNVRDGNDKLNHGDAKGALESYTLAARQLPEAPGVQLDRGLALLKSGDLAKARESLLSATTPSAPTALRADAYRNLALAFYREGDQLAGQNKHKEAQQMFRESVDAGKRSLRLRPGDADTAWNLELAARRVREEEQKQKEEEEKQKQEQKDQQKDKDKQDQQQDQQQNQGDQKQDDQQKPEDQKQNQDKSKDDQQQKQDQQKQDQQPKQDPKQDQQQPQQGQDQQAADQQEQAEPQQLPAEAEQALDALGNSEENFERYRARQRASRERRAPEKDW